MKLTTELFYVLPTAMCKLLTMCLWCQWEQGISWSLTDHLGEKGFFHKVSRVLYSSFWGHMKKKKPIPKYLERNNSCFPLWVLCGTEFSILVFILYVHVTSSGVFPEVSCTNVFTFMLQWIQVVKDHGDSLCCFAPRGLWWSFTLYPVLEWNK